ncbi:hypothetical protein C2R22_18910 [Salinigranum rubrum]|uniref:Malate dehydrogenase n=1 Tax=Salinigranum rubrum TaxID=755307 RepID=A0A2I8VNE9_9EURY|nr:Ldh family oxidoreductase [Salinigranum rubrum]AUV83457.1 hypothetical protein C2R22_18910 [Salinigranum rubrum]
MVTVAPSEVEPFVEDVCCALGCDEETADAVATSLVLSDRQGHASHGVFRIGQYADRVERGAVDATATPTVERTGAGTALVDGNRAFGQAVGRVATDEVTAQAEGGVGAVGITNVGHLGRIGEWAQRATERGYLFVALVRGSTQSVAPPNSADRCFSTNPVVFGVPTFDALSFSIVIDMATSQVAHGKIRTKAADGEPIPEGWAIDEDGEPLLDARAFAEGRGAILPLGGTVAGHKGYGLCVAAELFAAILGTSPVIGQATGSAAAFVAVDPTVFLPVEEIEARVEALASLVRNATYIEGTGLLPGEPEYRAMRETDEHGLELGPGTVAELQRVAETYGLEGSLPAGTERLG